MTLLRIGLLALKGRLERRVWVHAIQQPTNLRRERLAYEMPIHLAQLVVDHPS